MKKTAKTKVACKKCNKTFVVKHPTEGELADRAGFVARGHKIEIEKVKQHPAEIFEYIRRRRHGRTLKVGVILGVKDRKVVRVGWSKCNFKAGDDFNDFVGFRLALNRALVLPMPKSKSVLTPKCIRRQVEKFSERCKRYFKDATKVLLPA